MSRTSPFAMDHPGFNGLRHAGPPVGRSSAVVVLLHGRGSSPDDMMGLTDLIGRNDIAYLAPAAAQRTWYPQRFLAPVEANEPWLSDALSLIEKLVGEVIGEGIPEERIALLGFSQGACLALDAWVARPRRYRFVAALSGALIGPLDRTRPAVRLGGVPVLLGCADQDAHIPAAFVDHSETLLAHFGATVTRQRYPGSAHTVFPDEIAWIKDHLPVAG